MDRWKITQTEFGPVSIDTDWVCRLEPMFPRFRQYESAAIRAVLARAHRYMPFPSCSRFPTTRPT